MTDYAPEAPKGIPRPVYPSNAELQTAMAESRRAAKCYLIAGAALTLTGVGLHLIDRSNRGAVTIAMGGVFASAQGAAEALLADDIAQMLAARSASAA